MIIDGLLAFDKTAGGQAITNSAASTDVVDLAHARDLGVPEEHNLAIAAIVGTAFSTTNSATLQMQFQGSTNGSAWTTYAETAALAAAGLVAGADIGTFSVPTLPPGVALPRYWRLNYVVGTGVFSAGTIQAFVVLDKPSAVRAYPAGITVAN